MIKKLFASILAVILSVIVILMNASVAYADNIQENVYDRINDYLTEIIPRTHFLSFSITIVDKNDILFSKNYGSMGSVDTPYALGSVSKSFTALCIMQLAEQGKVSLDAHISEYIPDATDGDRITIIQLLNHTSGLGEHQNLTNYSIVNEQGVHLYANVNYSLLGEVIETVSGKTYEDYVTENIFEPLDMKDTFADPKKAAENGLIDGYENWFGINMKTENKYRDDQATWITVPAGYICSSADDLGKYLQMYLNGGNGIVSRDSINEMFYNSVHVDDYIPYEYGMGWTLINKPLKEPALRHSGLVENGMSCIYILPEREMGIAITINSNDYFVGADFADRVGWGVILMLMGDEPNQIDPDEYVLRHLMYDGIYLMVLIISLLPLICIGKYNKRLQKHKIWRIITGIILLHALFPTFILLLSRLFFDTPLWVVKAFVPDMFAVIMISSFLLIIGGIVKICLIIKFRHRM